VHPASVTIPTEAEITPDPTQIRFFRPPGHVSEPEDFPALIDQPQLRIRDDPLPRTAERVGLWESVRLRVHDMKAMAAVT
jgi:hypothetical protein